MCKAKHRYSDNVQPKNGKLIRPEPASCHCQSDASGQGWGYELETNAHANGRWHENESEYSINSVIVSHVFCIASIVFKCL